MDFHKKLTLTLAYELLWGLPGLTNMYILERMYHNTYGRFILSFPELNPVNMMPHRQREAWPIVGDQIWMSGNIDGFKISYKHSKWDKGEVIIVSEQLMMYNDHKHSQRLMWHLKDVADQIIQFLISKQKEHVNLQN